MEMMNVPERLAALQARAASGELEPSEAAAWYALVTELREVADYYERGLIRHLKHERGLKWREVAEIVGVDSRQGAFQRWRRLIGVDRREYRHRREG